MSSNICDSCALRLFNDKCHCLEGVGNPNYGTLIVVPNVDYNAYKNKGMTFSKYVEIIKKVDNLKDAIECDKIDNFVKISP